MAARPSRGPGRKPGARGGASAQRGPSGQRGGRSTARATTARKKSATAGTGPQLTTRAIVLLSVVLLLVASYTSTFHAWWQLRSEIQSSRAEIVMRKQAITDLKDQEVRWNDPAYVKQQAKERFGWVSPGETGYRVIGSDGKVQGADVPTLDAPAVAKSPEWYDKLWGSVKESGRSPSQQQANQPDPEQVLKDR